MEGLAVLLIVLVIGALVSGPIALVIAIVALQKANRMEEGRIFRPAAPPRPFVPRLNGKRHRLLPPRKSPKLPRPKQRRPSPFIRLALPLPRIQPPCRPKSRRPTLSKAARPRRLPRRTCSLLSSSSAPAGSR